jgi:hypothetical protein
MFMAIAINDHSELLGVGLLGDIAILGMVDDRDIHACMHAYMHDGIKSIPEYS